MSTAQSSPGSPESDPVSIKVVDSGPLQVKGPLRLLDHEGATYDIPARRAIFLCRCGRSATKPFCDGSHQRTGFTATERARCGEDAANPPERDSTAQ